MMKTKGTATLLIALGGIMLTIGLIFSWMTAPGTSEQPINLSTNATCLDCHDDPHPTWQIAPHDVLLTQYTPTPASCVTCHPIGDAAVSDMNANTPDTHTRLLMLQHRLADAVAQHPEWQTERGLQTEVEKAESILAMAAADHEWGFHSNEYLNLQMDEAEALLNSLDSLNH